MVWEVLRLNASFVCFLGPEECFSGGTGTDPLTVRYINSSLWSRRLLSNVSRLRLVSMGVTNPGCLERWSPVMKHAALASEEKTRNQ